MKVLKLRNEFIDYLKLYFRKENMEIRLIGDHQVNNAVLALTVIKVLKDERNIEISEEAIRRGFLNTAWPGRKEIEKEFK